MFFSLDNISFCVLTVGRSRNSDNNYNEKGLQRLQTFGNNRGGFQNRQDGRSSLRGSKICGFVYIIIAHIDSRLIQ